MAWHAVPVAIMAGICLYAAALFVGLHAALAQVADRRAHREYLSFALCCIAVAGYEVSCAVLYNATSLDQGIFAQRAQFLTAGAVGVTYVQLTWDILKTRMPAIVRIGQVAMGVLAIISAFWESTLTLTPTLPAIKHVALLGTTITYHEAAPGACVQVLLLSLFVLLCVLVVTLYRHFRRNRDQPLRGHRAFLIAVFVSGLCVTNDILITSEVYAAVYTFEYGVAAIFMAMGYVLLMRFGALHEAINGLNGELSRANTELSAALAQAQESVRIKTEFLASMSHELRTPLNAIINLPEFVIDGFESRSTVSCLACAAAFLLDPGEVLQPKAACEACGARALVAEQQLAFTGDATTAQKSLRTVVRSGQHLLGLVNDILSASKLELGRAEMQPEPVDVRELILEVVASAQTVANQKQVEIRVHEPEPDLSSPLLADRVKLAQVLYNLIGNAIKFSNDGSFIEVGMSAPASDRRLLCVRDHGVGIAREHHEMIFEKFRQVDGGTTRAYGGTGLGLAISKGLVELHGGRIWVESAKGQGAAFYVELPARKAS